MMSTYKGRKHIPIDHSLLHYVQHEGHTLPVMFEPIDVHLQKIHDMHLLSDDVIICSYPKSGTHWLNRVVGMLQLGESTYDSRGPDTLFLDMQKIEIIDQQESPRLLLTHLPMNYLPREVQDKGTKIVHVYRNPKAIFMSWYFQSKEAKMLALQGEVSLEQNAEFFLSGQAPYGGWFNFMDKVNEFQSKNPDHPFMSVSYEDMSMKPLDTVKHLADFLEVECSEELRAQIVDACSFQKQKEFEEKTDDVQRKLKFYRKGDMNDWKNYITVALSEKIDRLLRERSDVCPFSAKYC